MGHLGFPKKAQSGSWGRAGTPSVAALTQLQEEPVQPFRHGHLGWEQEGSGSSSVVALLGPPSPSGIPKWECGKCWTYRVGLWLVEPAVSGAEQVEGHLGMGPHLRQAG